MSAAFRFLLPRLEIMRKNGIIYKKAGGINYAQRNSHVQDVYGYCRGGQPDSCSIYERVTDKWKRTEGYILGL